MEDRALGAGSQRISSRRRLAGYRVTRLVREKANATQVQVPSWDQGRGSRGT